MHLTFLGACREVTGSSILIETGKKKILLDCGFFQGSRFSEERNYLPFAFDPKQIDFLIVCHAHLDHVGRIPKLVKDGFGGKIFSTAPTKELAELVLRDSFKLMVEEARYHNTPILYDERDIVGAMSLFESIAYRQELDIFDGIKLTLLNAGHILGSSVCVLSLEGKRIAYTSDLGNAPSALLSAPDIVESADFVISETTYGGRIHEDVSKRGEKLNSIINSTIAQDGVLIIPTFAIERAQELLHDIEHFCKVGNCSIPTFYLDSPLAQKVTKVFQKYPEFMSKKINSEQPSDVFGLARVQLTSTVDQSRQIEFENNPKIIMAGSGMMNGGRILYHLQNYIEDVKNTLLIVGYQARGTLGRRILDGEKVISIFGKKYKVGANIHAIGSYSAHADAPQLLSWVSSISDVKKVFLVHGEAEQSIAFAKQVEAKMKVDAIVPQQNEQFDL